MWPKVFNSVFLNLTIGNNGSESKESVPFLIEWVPKILPESGFGELSISFQFGHTGPIETDENTNSKK